jgi:DNA (cytosine-5)-methyltransferase 1
MRHGSLFSGIGGFDLASEWMGWENVFHCEWNPFGQKVLNYYWPNAISYYDITKTDFTIHRGGIDIITGGFPCQPYSSAGKRLGKEDERHLWPEMLRAIREIQPTWVVGENVRGLTNWNGGLVFDEVQAELESEGYEVTPFLLPACAVNAPHRRDRIWFVAYSIDNRYSPKRNKISKKDGIQEIGRKEMDTREFNRTSFPSNASDSDNKGLERSASKRIQGNEGRGNRIQNAITTRTCNERNTTDSERIRLEHSTEGGEIRRKETDASREGSQSTLSTKADGNGYKSKWDNFPTVSPICSRDDGLSDRLDGITFSKWRNESIKAGGNAIVPQVVHQIFKAIQQYETTRQA